MSSSAPATQARRVRPDASYASGFSTNIELLLAPWFVVFGAAFALATFLTPDEPGTAEPPFDYRYIPVAFVVIGLILGYFAFFRRIYRLELAGETLSWFLPFHRLVGEAPITAIVSIRREQGFPWWVTKSVIELEGGRSISVRNRYGVRRFVSRLRTSAPHVTVTSWYELKQGESRRWDSRFDDRDD